jgi:chromosome segregation protein
MTGEAEATQLAIDRLQGRVRSLRAKLRQIGPVNAQAQADYDEARERHEFLTSQVADLRIAEGDVQAALDELRRVVRERFRETFHAVNADFGRYFKTFFGGGNARLVLTEPEDYGESGVDILAQPPGKRQQHLQLLSGGERALAAVALLFALLETNPAPFCVLDEVDAALDEANVGRFSETLAELADHTQFVLITHNRNTVQVAGSIYGITMSGDGVSTVLSLRLEGQEAAAGEG